MAPKEQQCGTRLDSIETRGIQRETLSDSPAEKGRAVPQRLHSLRLAKFMLVQPGLGHGLEPNHEPRGGRVVTGARGKKGMTEGGVEAVTWGGQGVVSKQSQAGARGEQGGAGQLSAWHQPSPQREPLRAHPACAQVIKDTSRRRRRHTHGQPPDPFHRPCRLLRRHAPQAIGGCRTRLHHKGEAMRCAKETRWRGYWGGGRIVGNDSVRCQGRQHVASIHR